MRHLMKTALVLALSACGALTAIPGAAQSPLPAVPAPAAAPPPAPATVAAPIPHHHHAAAPAAPAVVAPTAPPPAQGLVGARLAPGTAIPADQLEVLVDGVVRQAMANDHIAGVAVSVVQNGQVVLKKGYGFAGTGRPVDPDKTLFRLASISKTFTWITLMREVDAGHIRMAEPINLFLPEKLQIKDQGFKRPILVRDLPTHTPGFEDRSLGQLFEENPKRIRPLNDYLRQERPRRVREAGLFPSYSNYGAALAGAAVAYVNGHPYQDIVDSEIIHPLGLQRTTFREPYPARADLPAPMPATLAGDVSTGYRWSAGGFIPQSFEYVTQIAPAAALSSTAGDMARYMLMILGGGQLDGATIYSPAAAVGFRTTLQAPAPGVNGWDNGFGEFALPGGFRGLGHGGDTLWFHSMMVTVPALNLGVFVTTNTDTGPKLAFQLPMRIVGQFYAPPQDLPRPGSPALAANPSAYAGTYLTTRRPYSGLERFVFLLIGQTKIAVTDDGRLTAGGEMWTPDGPDGHFRQINGPQTMAFAMDGGRAVRWFPSSGTVAFDRIGPLYQIPTLALVALLTVLASIAAIVGMFTRDRREFRQTPMQSRAGLVQITIAVLWLIAVTFGGVFALKARDVGQVMYHWPGFWLMIGSACALMAALLTLMTIIMLPAVWRGGRRVDSWSDLRKLRFTAATVIFAAFSLLLMLWGVLEPWSG
jgi:CubicO group peptidase (beta-lactamase class C family)